MWAYDSIFWRAVQFRFHFSNTMNNLSILIYRYLGGVFLISHFSQLDLSVNLHNAN